MGCRELRGDLRRFVAAIARVQSLVPEGDLHSLRDRDVRVRRAHGKSFLDIGCGSGAYCVEFAKRVLGLDFSEPMLELARGSAAKLGVGDAVEFRRGEFVAHDFGIETFDVSVAMGVFDYLEQPQPFLAKMSQLTRGKVIASFPQFSMVRGTARRLRYRLTGRRRVLLLAGGRVATR
jgi:2-polyprenyl-3-methyl-5-hydroxy-6-metoxy-1,4-benzoquinol methylase